LAGVVGAVLTIVASAALLSVTGPMIPEQFRGQIESNPDLPPQRRDMLLNLRNGRGLALLQFAVTLPMFAVFSMLGALLGLAFFKKKPQMPPQMPPSVPPVV